MLNCLIIEVKFDDRKILRRGNRNTQGISICSYVIVKIVAKV